LNLVAERWASFDCYGTLIDWETGIRRTFGRLWPGADADALVEAYHKIERTLQKEGDVSYRTVLTAGLRNLAEEEGLSLERPDEAALAESLPGWPVFPEVPAALAELRRRRWRLAVLSNTDPDLLSASLAAIGVPVDLRVTAAEARSYKPAHGHWDRFLADTGVERERHVHVAASLFHDIAPAAGELGLQAVWINRKGEITNLPRDAELPDLSELPDTLERIVAAGAGA
jgi:2-haloacid dehalogenase